MSDLSETVNSILGVLGIAVILGGAMPVLIGSYRKSKMEELKTNNKDLNDRVVILEKNEEVHKAKIESLEKENGYLKDLISLRAPVEKVIEKLDAVASAINDAVAQRDAQFQILKEEIDERRP